MSASEDARSPSRRRAPALETGVHEGRPPSIGPLDRVRRAVTAEHLVDLGAVCALALIAATVIFPRDELFSAGIDFFGGRLKVTDFLLAGAVGLWAAGLALGAPARLPPPAVSVLVGLFLLLACVAVFTAHARGTALKMSLLELRPLLSLLLVFPLVGAARRFEHVARGVMVVALAATVTSFTILAQYVAGETGAVADGGGAERVHGALFVYPAALAVWAGCAAVLLQDRRARVAAAAAAALGLVALFFTFQRGGWLALAAAVLVVVVLLPGAARRRLALGAPVLLGAALVVVVVANALSSAGASNVIASGTSRAASILALGEDESARHRLNEWRRAGELVRDRPLRGIGLGSTITFYSPLYNERTKREGGLVTVFYIHSSYVWLALKLGLVAALVFVALLCFVAAQGLLALRSAQDTSIRLLLVGALASLVVLAVSSLTGPHLTSDNTTPFYAGLVALVSVLASPAPSARRRSNDAADPAL